MLIRTIIAFVVFVLSLPVKAELPIVDVGQQRIVIKSGQYNTTHFPDQPISILSTRPLRVLVVAGKSTKLLEGRNWNNISSARFVLHPSPGAQLFDSNYAGIGGAFQAGDTVYGLYHAEKLTGTISKVRNEPAIMFSIGLAVSRDRGNSFTKVGQVLTSRHPFEPGKECGGIGDVSMCLDKTGKFLLAFYGDFSRGQDKNIQICTARCALNDKAMPGSWKKYHNGSFSEPGLGGKETYVLSMFDAGADAWSPHVCYSNKLDRYIMTFSATFGRETDGASYFKPERSGIYIATSANGVDWSTPVPVFIHGNLFLDGVSAVQHPTLHLTGTTRHGIKGTLYYAYTPSWPKPTHHLASRTVEIRLTPPSQAVDPNSIAMEFKRIPAGSFTMGAGDAAHEVTLTMSFEIGVHEVTQRQYQTVMGTNPSHFTGPDNPVEQVSRKDALEFCRRLSDLPKEKDAGYTYRLPTEAEWEYACRAGSRAKFSFGEFPALIDEYAWWSKNSKSSTHPVGQLKSNEWGLHDMLGNVGEWCQDWHSDDISHTDTNPTGPATGTHHVRRGGSWNLTPNFSQSAFRGKSTPDNRHSSIGFRVVRINGK